MPFAWEHSWPVRARSAAGCIQPHSGQLSWEQAMADSPEPVVLVTHGTDPGGGDGPRLLPVAAEGAPRGAGPVWGWLRPGERPPAGPALSSYEALLIELRPGEPCPALEAVSPAARVLRWDAEAEGAGALLAGLWRLLELPARLYEVRVRSLDLALAGLAELRRLGRRDVLIYERGAGGLGSRVLSALYAAPVLICGPEPETSAARVRRDYGALAGAPEALFAIIGPRTRTSLSPFLHNHMYRALGLPYLFLSLGEHGAEQLAGVLGDRLPVPARGLTVTGELKRHAAALASDVQEEAQQACSANLLVRGAKGWRAHSTDVDLAAALFSQGLIRPGERALVLGCGGSGRAVAAALHRRGARAALCNRGEARGRDAASSLGLPFVPLPELDLRGVQLVVNATPAGALAEHPALQRLSADLAVVELAYGAVDGLAARGRRAGCRVLDGLDVLRIQVARQFEGMTGQRAPIDGALEALQRVA